MKPGMDRTIFLFHAAISAAWLLAGRLLAGEKVGELKDDEQKLAVLARAYRGASLSWMRSPDGRFVKPTK